MENSKLPLLSLKAFSIALTALTTHLTRLKTMNKIVLTMMSITEANNRSPNLMANSNVTNKMKDLL